MQFKDDNGWEWVAVLSCLVGAVFGAALLAWGLWDTQVTAIHNFYN